MIIKSTVFRNKKTGKLSTTISIMDINEWEEVKSPTKKQYEKATRAGRYILTKKLKKVM